MHPSPRPEVHGRGAPVFSPGQIVAGRYRILSYVDRGGMGEVYEAEDLELGERVALKTLLPEIAADPHSLSRFKQEIHLSRQIAHPNVCRVFDLSRHPVDGSGPDAVYFLTMEFLAGETLESRLARDGPMSQDQALPLLEQMAAALDAAHRAAIIHRDFKPSNVILTSRGGEPAAVVTDFGLARSNQPAGSGVSTQTGTLAGHVLGTPGYMAPELLRGAQASVRADVYALGVTAYRMIAGALPASPDLTVPGADANWKRAIGRALSPDPAQRFASAGELVEALRGQSAAPRVLRRRAWIVAAAAIVLLAAWFGWKSFESRQALPSPEAIELYRIGAAHMDAAAFFAATKALEKAVSLAPEFSLAHARLAEAWMELELSEKAGVEMLKARRYATTRLPAVDRLRLDAIEASITRDFPAAITRYEQMLPLAGAEKADIYLDIGRMHEGAAQIPKALESYVAASRAEPRNPAAWLRRAALESRAPQQSGQADDEFRKAEELYQLMNNLEGLTELAYQRSVAANFRNQFDDAAAHARKALATAQITGNLHQQIRARLQIANSAVMKGDAALAETLAREAIDAAAAEHIDTLAIRGILIIGNAYFRKGDLAGAEKHYDQALDLARRNSAQRLAAQSLLSLANLHSSVKRHEDAVREARSALDFYAPNHFARESLQCLTLIGRAQRDRGDAAAVDTFREALQIAGKSQDSYQMTLAHQSLGSLLNEQQRLPEALTHYQEALHLAVGAEQTGWAAYGCGETLWSLGRFAEARAMLDQAEANSAKFPDLKLSVAVSEAEMSLAKRNLAEAAAGCRRALTAGPQPNETAHLNAILGLAQIRSGRRVEGLRNCELAASMGEKTGVLSLRRDLELALAEARIENGQSARALEELRHTLSTLDRQPLSRWRALALAARAGGAAGRGDAQAAIQQLDSIAHEWGQPALQQYLARPDVQPLWRTVSHLAPSGSR